VDFRHPGLKGLLRVVVKYQRVRVNIMPDLEECTRRTKLKSPGRGQGSGSELWSHSFRRGTGVPPAWATAKMAVPPQK